jgi:hypothetical protein
MYMPKVGLGVKSLSIMHSVPITTNVVSSNPVHSKVNSMQKYVIKFVNDLRQVGVILQFPPPIKLTAIAEILLKVVLNTTTTTPS